MKKILSLILSICVLMSAFTVLAAETTEEAPAVSESYVKNLNFIKALGLGDYTEKVPSDYITREEFAGVLAKLLGEEQTFVFEIAPMDMDASSEYYNAVSTMYAYGIMNGVSSTQFNPKGNITSFQAIKCMTTVLGYSEVIGAGGYPDEYVKLGQRLKLFKGVPMSDQPMTWENAINLVINSFDVAVMQFAAVNENKIIYSAANGETILSAYHNIYSGEGRVTDNGITTISGDPVWTKDGMVVGNVKGFAKDESIRTYIGQNIKFYYSENDGVINFLYAEPAKYTGDALVVKADDLILDSASFTKTNVPYYVGTKIQNAKIDPLADVIYNGKSFPTFMSSDLKIEAGQITFIDTNSDNLYDLLLVEEYVDVVISGVDTTTQCVYDYFGNSYSFSDDAFVTIYDKNMNIIDASQLTTNAVMSIYKSKDGECVKYVFCADRVTGDVTVKDERDGKTYITIGDTEYGFSPSLLLKLEEGYSGIEIPELGTNVNAYLNFEGKIVDSNVTKKEYMYAFCLRVGEEKVSFTRKTAAMKVVTQTGTEATLLAADKIRINQGEPTDGINLLNHADFYDEYDGEFIPQLIKVKINSKGEVNWIETATTVSTAPLGFEEGKFTLNASKDNGNNNGNNCYDGRYASTTSTVVFQVKRDTDYTNPADITIVKNGPYYASAKYYDANELWEAGAIVVWDNSSTIYYETTPIIVEKVNMTKNEDEEFVYNIKGQYGSREWSWVEAEPGLIESYCPEGLKTGDVIAIILDDYGRIKVLKKLLSLADKPDPFYMDIRGTYPYVDHGVVFGHVCAKNSTAFTLTTNGGSSVYSQSNSSTPVFLYDVANKTLTSALWKDIPVSAVRKGDTYTVTDDNTRVCVIRSRRRAIAVIIAKY